MLSCHWSAFREQAEACGGLPRFVTTEVDEYLRCGLLDRGFVRLACTACGHERLVAFSCKRRGFCPSCLGRRMTDSALHLTEKVFPKVMVRQWVWGLRVLLGYDKKLCSEVLHAFTTEVQRSLRRRAKHALGLDSVELPASSSLSPCHAAAARGVDLAGDRKGQPSLRLIEHEAVQEGGSLERSRGVDDLLAKELDAATDADHKRRVLLAISNSGSVELLPKVRPLLQNENHKLAAASVAALRLMPGTEVDRLLAAALAHSVRSVRVQALDAMRARSVSEILVSAVVQVALAADASDALRGVRLLELWRKNSDEVRRALHTIAASASTEKARKAARRVLPG